MKESHFVLMESPAVACKAVVYVESCVVACKAVLPVYRVVLWRVRFCHLYRGSCCSM